MVKKLLNNILANKDVRQNLSALRQEIKQPTAKKQLAILIEPHTEYFITLLDSEDAKTRKNAALLMGDLASYDYLDALYQGYQREVQLFVKSAYLTALRAFDCSVYLEDLKEQMNILSKIPLTPENKKHVEDEIRALSRLLIQEEGITQHTFSGYHERYDCILLTNRLHKEVTESLIEGGELRPFPAGVRVITEDIESILALRTYSELLLVIPGLTTVPMDPTACAKALNSSNLLIMLQKSHKEKSPFYFRIGLKSKMSLDKTSDFTKKLSSNLERLSNRQLLNSTSNYEVEIRLIENKSGTFNVLLKLATLPDDRFSYRKESISASIKPVNAALLVALAKEYMIEDARILDPFCGVGTMLIERQKIVKGNTSYGIDFFSPAIEKAKINTKAANQIIHFINRDFFDFTHEHVFDEIFTNMPFAMGHKSQEEIYDIYKGFFKKAKDMLTPSGRIIMYSHDRDYVIELAEQFGYGILKEYTIMQKEDTHLIILG